MNEKLMFEYMAEIDLPMPIDNEFISLIPAQRAMINKLMNERIITSYAVSIEDGKLWTTLIAESEEDAESILLQFPIIDRVEYAISKLAFHNNISLQPQQFSLN